MRATLLSSSPLLITYATCWLKVYQNLKEWQYEKHTSEVDVKQEWNEVKTDNNNGQPVTQTSIYTITSRFDIK